MPGLDLEAKDDFNFPVIPSAWRYERYDVIIYGSRELGAFEGRIEELNHETYIHTRSAHPICTDSLVGGWRWRK